MRERDEESWRKIEKISERHGNREQAWRVWGVNWRPGVSEK